MPGQPYVAKLPDGRYFAVELPENSTEEDPLTGELILQPAAVHLLDKLRTLLSPLPPTTTPGRLTLLRDALGLTRQQLASYLSIEPGAIAAWEAGIAKPGAEHLAALEAIRSRAARTGVVLLPLAKAS